MVEISTLYGGHTLLFMVDVQFSLWFACGTVYGGQTYLHGAHAGPFMVGT